MISVLRLDLSYRNTKSVSNGSKFCCGPSSACLQVEGSDRDTVFHPTHNRDSDRARELAVKRLARSDTIARIFRRLDAVEWVIRVERRRH